jgi:hypothetical protein
VLLLIDVPEWSIFGLVGGGTYLYFAGRGIAQRITLKRRGIAIGAPASQRIAYVFLSLWAVAAIASIALASAELVSAGGQP